MSVDRKVPRNPLRHIHSTVGGNLKKRLTTKNIQENEAISKCKIEKELKYPLLRKVVRTIVNIKKLENDTVTDD